MGVLRMHFRSGPIFAIILMIVFSAGCLFEPRDPEPPGNNQIDYLPATDTDNVLENLQRAIGALDPNGYERMLSSDFAYEPDGGALANYPDVDWERWDSYLCHPQHHHHHHLRRYWQTPE